jgi:hypothetical protein
MSFIVKLIILTLLVQQVIGFIEVILVVRTKYCFDFLIVVQYLEMLVTYFMWIEIYQSLFRVSYEFLMDGKTI